jgi:hypothetical protein
MARHTKFGWWKDQQGKVINAETLTVSLTGTTTVATIYEDEVGGSAITNGAITLSSVGFFQYWVDESDYATTQRFRHTFTGGKFKTLTLDDIVIFPGITASSSDTLTNKIIDADNNTISNLEIGAEVKATVVALLNMAGFDISNIGVAFLKEQAAAEANVAASGQLWVKTATPNVVMFSDDTGADFTLTHTANKLSVFAATTSAELAGVLSDETGSGGGFARATSPTFVTPVIGDASGTSLTLTGTTDTDANTLTKLNIIACHGSLDNSSGTPAWNGTPYNFTSSFTDNGTGNTEVFMDTDMANANYTIVVTCDDAALSAIGSAVNKTASSVDVACSNDVGSAVDRDISIIIVGAQ